MKKFKEWLEAMTVRGTDIPPSGVTVHNDPRPQPLDHQLNFQSIRNNPRGLAAYQNALTRLSSSITPVTSSDQVAANLALFHTRKAMEWLQQYSAYAAHADWQKQVG